MLKLSEESYKIIAKEVKEIEKKRPKVAQQPVQEFGSVAESNLQVLMASVQDPSEYEEILKTLVSYLDETTADKAIRDTMAQLYPPKEY